MSLTCAPVVLYFLKHINVICRRPMAEQRHGLVQSAAEVGQSVLRLGGNNLEGLSMDETITLQIARHLN
jgi:hypothetical protein